MAHRQLHFGLNVLSAGMHPAAWLAKESDPLGYIKPEQWLRLVQIAEQGTFDAIFLADEPGLNLGPDGTLPGPSWAALDPLVLLSSLASISNYVGLAGTLSTTYEEPYNVARRFASLDHVSRGRAAWNVVTTVDATVQATSATNRIRRVRSVTRARLSLSRWRGLYGIAGTMRRTSPTRHRGASPRQELFARSIIGESAFTLMDR